MSAEQTYPSPPPDPWKDIDNDPLENSWLYGSVNMRGVFDSEGNVIRVVTIPLSQLRAPQTYPLEYETRELLETMEFADPEQFTQPALPPIIEVDASDPKQVLQVLLSYPTATLDPQLTDILGLDPTTPRDEIIRELRKRIA